MKSQNSIICCPNCGSRMWQTLKYSAVTETVFKKCADCKHEEAKQI